MTDSELEALEHLAKKASPGPWFKEVDFYDGLPIPMVASQDREIASTAVTEDFQEQDSSNANYIAAVSPTIVLALIQDLRTLMNYKCRI